MDVTHKKALIIPLLILSSLLLITTTTTVAAAAAAAGKELCHPDDKKALLGIKSWFNDNYLFSSWFPDKDCCKVWYMVKCDRTTHRINSLSVASYANLSGTIPPSVADLPFLSYLAFRKLPNLTGTIPASVATLRHLAAASFDSNALSGPVPSFFGRMASLQQLTLAFNRFSGSVPPQLARAPALIFLDLSRNLLTGPIPDSFGSLNQNGSSPLTLILSHNQLAGPIPASLGSPSFVHIDFSRNNLTGDASFLFGPNKTLQILDLSRNQLSFNFSAVDMSSSITSLDLNHNKVFGGFPTTGLENVYYLNVSYNRLCGPIPNVGQLPTFDQTTYFHNKCLCGPPLPACNSTA